MDGRIGFIREIWGCAGAPLSRLPPLDREVLVLRAEEERSYEEIAATTGLTAEAARWRSGRVSQQLRLFLPRLSAGAGHHLRLGASKGLSLAIVATVCAAAGWQLISVGAGAIPGLLSALWLGRRLKHIPDYETARQEELAKMSILQDKDE